LHSAQLVSHFVQKLVRPLEKYPEGQLQIPEPASNTAKGSAQLKQNEGELLQVLQMKLQGRHCKEKTRPDGLDGT